MARKSDIGSRRKLQWDIEVLENHLKVGYARIVGGYLDDFQVSQYAEEDGVNVDKVTRLIDEHHDTDPPHESIIEVASLFLQKGLDQYDNIAHHVLGDAENEFNINLHYIYLCIGTEYLLNGIIIEDSPEVFEDVTDIDRWRSVGLSKIVQDREVRNILFPEYLDEKQKNLIEDVLSLLKLHRDNLVHLGYHTGRSGNEEVFHHVIGYFVSEFTDEEETHQQLKKRSNIDSLNTEDYNPLPMD